jgi:MFS family permease
MQTNRIAVATFFFINGFVYANWAGRLPELQNYFSVSNTLLGTLLFLGALGALSAMPFSGWLTARFGSRKITQTTALLFCSVVPMLVLLPNIVLAGIFLFILGAANGTVDVAMNAQAVFVERLYQKPIMSSFHGVFSLGMALGAGSAALFSKLECALLPHFLIISLLGVLATTWASFYLVKDAPASVVAPSEAKAPAFLLPTKAVIPLGIIAFCGMTGEGSMGDWSALFVHKVVGETAFFGAIVFGIFAAAMTIGRFLGDYAIERFGKAKVLIYSSLLTIFGLSLALVFISIYTTVIGFFLVGLGLANVVPIVYSSAGNTEGVDPSSGIAMATSIGYAGFFVGPPSIGFLADHFGLRLALCFTLILFGVMLFLVQSQPKKA